MVSENNYEIVRLDWNKKMFPFEPPKPVLVLNREIIKFVRFYVELARGQKMCLIDAFMAGIRLHYTLEEVEQLIELKLDHGWSQKGSIVYGLYPELKEYCNREDDSKWFEYDEIGRIKRLAIIDEIIKNKSKI